MGFRFMGFVAQQQRDIRSLFQWQTLSRCLNLHLSVRFKSLTRGQTLNHVQLTLLSKTTLASLFPSNMLVACETAMVHSLNMQEGTFRQLNNILPVVSAKMTATQIRNTSGTFFFVFLLTVRHLLLFFTCALWRTASKPHVPH